MLRVTVYLASAMASAAGWWLGAHVGLMTAFLASVIGTGVGLWAARRFLRQLGL